MSKTKNIYKSIKFERWGNLGDTKCNKSNSNLENVQDNTLKHLPLKEAIGCKIIN